MTSPPPASDASTRCPACGAVATGKFCSNCAAPLAGAICGACSAPLTPGAKFCHRCGTPAGADVPAVAAGRSQAVPWSVAGIALLALLALVAGQHFSRAPSDSIPTTAMDTASTPLAGAPGGGVAPDISNLSAAEAALRLYNRVMGAHQRGRADSVQIFAPMAIAAYQMIGALDLDQRYDLGRLAAVSGDEPLARAESDTILARHPNHLLGLILAGNAARLRKDTAAERTLHDKLVAAAPGERAKQLPEYVTHENDIAIALGAPVKQP